VARLDSRIAGAARQFVLLRLTNMRGVDLDLFEFDYDLTWMAFFLNAEGNVYGRFGGRDPDSATKYLRLPALRHALEKALAAHRQGPPDARPDADRPIRTVEQYPAAGQLAPGACIHCHQVYGFRREALQAAGRWRLDEVWVYPLPENVGLSLDPECGDRVRGVRPGSPADRAKIVESDVLESLAGRAIASFADMQYALHKAPESGAVEVMWRRAGQVHHGRLELVPGWRRTDVSWRWSLRGLEPGPNLHGEDLTAQEKKILGLSERQLAFRQGPFVSQPAQQAGIHQNDIIVGLDGKRLEMTARQFGAYVRLNYRPGASVTVNLLRAGRRLDLVMKLAG
jgi:hypothetical protein